MDVGCRVWFRWWILFRRSELLHRIPTFEKDFCITHLDFSVPPLWPWCSVGLLVA